MPESDVHESRFRRLKAFMESHKCISTAHVSNKAGHNNLRLVSGETINN